MSATGLPDKNPPSQHEKVGNAPCRECGEITTEGGRPCRQCQDRRDRTDEAVVKQYTIEQARSDA